MFESRTDRGCHSVTTCQCHVTYTVGIPSRGRSWVLRRRLSLTLTTSCVVSARSTMLAADPLPEDDPASSNQPKDPISPSQSTPLDTQSTQEHTEVASVHSLPAGHVASIHSAPERPSTARSPPSSETHAFRPAELHAHSSTVSVDPARDRHSRRRSSMEVNFPCSFTSNPLNFDPATAL